MAAETVIFTLSSLLVIVIQHIVSCILYINLTPALYTVISV